MKGKYKNRTRVEKGYGPRHAMNAQEGSEAVPGELPTPPDAPETLGGAYIGEAADALKNAIISPKDMAQIRADPTGLQSIPVYARALTTAGTMVGGEGELAASGSIAKKTANLLFKAASMRKAAQNAQENGYARATAVGPRHADAMFQSGTSDTSGYNSSGFYGNVLQPQDVEKMRQAMDAPGRSSLSPIEETLAANPDASSFYFDQGSGNYVPFGGASGYQGGEDDVTPQELDARYKAQLAASERKRAEVMGEVASDFRPVLTPEDMAAVLAAHQGDYNEYQHGETSIKPGSINDEVPLPVQGNTEMVETPTDTSHSHGLEQLDIPPASETPEVNLDTLGLSPGQMEIINALGYDPSQNQGAGGGGMQLINELGYDPSAAYGSSGSGVPTQTGAGYGGQFVGGLLGNLLLPGIGGLVGSQLGGAGARMLTRSLQGGQVPWQTPTAQGGGQMAQGGGVTLPGDFFPGDAGGLGQPMGYFPWYSPGETGSSSYAPFTGGVGGEGGTLGNSDMSNVGAGPLPGSFAGLGSFGGGDLGSYGGGIGEHTPSFQAWVQGQGFPNVASYQAAMAGPPGPTMAMAGGGGGAPVGLQHATGGHIQTAQEGDNDVPTVQDDKSGPSFLERLQAYVDEAGREYGQLIMPDEHTQALLTIGKIALEQQQTKAKEASSLGQYGEPKGVSGDLDARIVTKPYAGRLEQLQKGKLAVAKGYGPTHAENSKEGEPLSTDTVPAMLTPREAVLNRNAAELAGRGNIQKLNSEGNQLADEGVDLAGKDKNMKQKYQKGSFKVAPVPLTGPKPTARADLAGIMKYLPMGQLARSAQSQAVMPKVGVRGYQAGTSATDPLSMYQNKLSTSPLGGGQSLGGGPGPSPFPGPSPTPNPGPGPMPVSTTPPPYGGRPVPTLGGAPAVPPRPDAGKDPSGAMSTPLSFNNWAANAGAPGFVTQPVPPQGPSMPPKGSQPSTPPNITIPPLPQSSGAAPPITTRTPPPLPSASFFPPPSPAQRTPPPLGFQGGTIDAPQAGTQFANVQYSAPQINIAALKQHLQSQGIQPNQISGIINQISRYQSSTPAASYGEGSSVSQDLGPALEAGFPGYQGGISDIGYPPMVGPNMVYHADKGSNWIGQFDPRYTFQRYWRGTGAVMPMGGMGPVMGARPFVHPVRPVPPVRF